MPYHKDFKFAVTPHGTYGKKLVVTLSRQDGEDAHFMLGSRVTWISTVGDLPGGCTVTLDRGAIECVNFPVVVGDSGVTESGSPKVEFVVRVRSGASSVIFDVVDTTPLPNAGGANVLTIDNRGVGVGQSPEFALARVM